MIVGLIKDTNPSVGLRLMEKKKAGKSTRQKERFHIVAQTRVNRELLNKLIDSAERVHGAGD